MFSCRTEFALKEIMSSGGAEDDIPQGERKTVTDFCYLLDKSKQLFNGLRSVDSWCLKLLSSSVSFFPHGWCVVSFWKLWIKCYINICSRNDDVFGGGCFFLKWKNNRRRVYLILFYSDWVSCFLRWFCVHYSTSYLFYIWFYTLWYLRSLGCMYKWTWGLSFATSFLCTWLFAYLFYPFFFLG